RLLARPHGRPRLVRLCPSSNAAHTSASQSLSTTTNTGTNTRTNTRTRTITAHGQRLFRSSTFERPLYRTPANYRRLSSPSLELRPPSDWSVLAALVPLDPGGLGLGQVL